jgi:eukaryotic-like serine/threonine-protein kinase
VSSDGRDAWIKLLQHQQLNEYSINDHLAGGNFSLVFDAVNPDSGLHVALKVLLPGATPDDIFEFEREAELLALLQRASNVVTLIESSKASIAMTGAAGIQVQLPIQFHVLEIASGCLEELIMARELVTLRERLSLWRGVVLGVHQMHLKQIVHRDIKSPNCLLFVRSGSRTDSKIADLGRGTDTRTTPRLSPSQYLVGRGDFRFAPPECLFVQGASDRRAFKLADLYGLGSLLFEVVTGQGITSIALGDGPAIVQNAANEALAGRRIDLSTLGDNYSAAYALFYNSIPKEIRAPATQLLKQLCHPVPESRLPRIGSGKRRPVEDGLGWLLNRADILIKGLARGQASSNAPRAAGKAS